MDRRRGPAGRGPSSPSSASDGGSADARLSGRVGGPGGNTPNWEGVTPTTYREYDASLLTRLAFIRSGQAAGFTLVEESSILDLRRDGAVPCAHVHSLLLTKLEDARARQRELAVLEAELEGLISRSDRLDPADCADVETCHIIAPGD